jgi:hypothetical protein
MRQEPAYQQAYRRASLKTLPLAGRIVGDNPAMDFFIRESVGARVLMVLMQEVRDDPHHRTGSGFYSRAASRSGVSRTHVRNMMREAEDRHLVELSTERGQFVAVLPSLRDAFEQWAADSIAGIDLVHTLAAEA